MGAKRFVRLLVFFVLVALVPWPLVITEQVGAAGADTVALRDLGFPDTSVTGALARQDFYFTGPGQASKLPATLNFSFSHSAQIDPARSAVRIEWNGLSVYTEALGQDSTNKVTRTVQIPADRVQPGANQATFVFLLLLPGDGSCPDDTNPGRVATVFQDTSVSYGVPVAAVKPDLNLGVFPNAFTQIAEPVTQILVALPQNPTSGELSAAATVAGQITKLAPNSKFLYRSIDPGYSLQPTDTHVVAIGSPTRNAIVAQVAPVVGFNTSGATFVTPDGRATTRETGFLMLGTVPNAANSTALVLTGVSDEAITNATRLFGSTQLLKTLGGQYGVAEQVNAPPTRDTTTARTITLFPQGLKLEGSRQSDINQRIVLPPLPDSSRVKVNLSVARSPNLNLDLSFLRLTLNGQAAGAVQLSNVTAQGTPVTLDVPARALKPGLNAIGFSATTRAPQGQCESSLNTQGGSSNVYLTVSPNVTIDTQEPATASPLSLALWPYPLLGGADSKPPTLVAGQDGIDALLNTASILGPLQDGDTVGYQALSAGPADPLPPDGNRIIFGTNDQLPYKNALQRDLPLELQGNVFTVRNKELATAKVSGTNPPGVLELVGNARGRTYVVTSAAPAQLDTAVRALVNTLPDTTSVIINQDAPQAANPQQQQQALLNGQGLRVQALTLPGAEIKTGKAKSALSSLNLLAAGLAALAVVVCGIIGFTGLRREE